MNTVNSDLASDSVVRTVQTALPDVRALVAHAYKLAQRLECGQDDDELRYTLKLIAESLPTTTPRELPLYRVMEAFAEAFPGHDLHQESIDYARAIERRCRTEVA